jgi:hypothetical protein
LIALQDDKDLVHEFVQNEGLGCLLKLGREADSNHQNYILRGQRNIFLLLKFTRGCCCKFSFGKSVDCNDNRDCKSLHGLILQNDSFINDPIKILVEAAIRNPSQIRFNCFIRICIQFHYLISQTLAASFNITNG